MEEETKQIAIVGAIIIMPIMLIAMFFYLNSVKTKELQQVCFQELKTVECWNTYRVK